MVVSEHSGAPSVLAATPLPLADLPVAVRRALDGIEEFWVYSLPLNVRFRGVTHREGLLLRGPYGWGEASPFMEYLPREASMWLKSALSCATVPAVRSLRTHVFVNVTIPVVGPKDAARRVHRSGGCLTAKVKVADPRVSLSQDCARVEAVADALRQVAQKGASASGQSLAPRLRVDVNGVWDVDQAVHAIKELDRAAADVGGLEYVEQPCAAVEDLAAVRKRVNVRIAADESIRRAEDPLRIAALEAADVAVVKVAPLGGVERALQIGYDTGLDLVISSALESSVGLASGVRAAAALGDAPFACGLATAQLLAADTTSVPLLPEGGQIELRPVSPDLLVTARGVAEERVGWWRAHLADMCAYL